jgi:predicted Zn-dependent protease
MKYIVLFITLCCLSVGCTTSRPMPANRTLTADLEEQLIWRRAEQEQEAIYDSGVLYWDANLENYLNQIAAKLQENSGSREPSIKIKVVKDPTLNAFAFPNGVIYIHSGILARMENEAQLAALLSHEMIHCTHRHYMKARRNIKDRKLAPGSALQRVAKTQNSMVRRASSCRFTRELETEADRVGLDLMIKSNYDPKEVLRLFELMQQEIEVEGIREPYFFGSHPNVRQRIQNVNHWLAEKYRGKITGVINAEIYQSRISRLILENVRMDLRRGRFSVAQKTVEKLLVRMPDDARAYYLLGEILRQRGRHDDAAAAIKYYEKSIALNPSFSEAHKSIGLIHYKDGEKSLAKKYFETCLLLSPDAIDKAYIQGYLKLCTTNGEG